MGKGLTSALWKTSSVLTTDVVTETLLNTPSVTLSTVLSNVIFKVSINSKVQGAEAANCAKPNSEKKDAFVRLALGVLTVASP